MSKVTQQGNTEQYDETSFTQPRGFKQVFFGLSVVNKNFY
jgi:hypothetical protein